VLSRKAEHAPPGDQRYGDAEQGKGTVLQFSIVRQQHQRDHHKRCPD